MGFSCEAFGGRLETPQYRLDTGYQFLGVKWFDHIIIRAQLKPQHLIEDLTFAESMMIGTLDL